MTFGQALRKARETRGWSRLRLLLTIREQHKDPRLLSETAIIGLERGTTKNPHGSTRSLLVQVLPEIENLLQTPAT